MATAKKKTTASKKKSSKSKKSTKKLNKNQKTLRAALILGSVFAILFLILSMFLSFYTDLLGGFGEGTVSLWKGMFGSVAYILPFVIAFSAYYYFYQKKHDCNYLKIYAAFGFVLSFSIMQQMLTYKEDKLPIKLDDFYYDTLWSGGGGVIGGLFGELLKKFLPYIAIFAIFFILAVVCFFIVFDKWCFKLFDFVKETGEELKKNRAQKPAQEKELSIFERLRKKKDEDEPDDEEFQELPPVPEFNEDEQLVEKSRDEFFDELFSEDQLVANIKKSRGIPDITDFAEEITEEVISEEEEEIFEPEEPEYESDEDRIHAEKENLERILMGEGEEATEDSAPAELPKKSKNIPYKFPSVELLNDNPKKGLKTDNSELKANALRLETILKSFGVEATVKNIERGPSITRYEMQLKSGVRINKIQSLQDDIKMNMAAKSIRIAPIPGKTLVGVEVSNDTVTPVFVKEIISSDEFKENKSKIAFTVGMDIAGKPVVGDLAKMPHVLIAGATGSGKSVCINTLIASILYKADPNEVKLIMVDPKVVELSVYNGIPHLLIPVVTDPKKAAGALNWAVMEMQNRYKAFADNGVRNIEGYNEMMLNQGNREAYMPKIVIIIDELADLMMAAPKDVEGYICRLAQLARAAGMHLVIATQRPSVNVITGLIKANVPSRIAFAVSSSVDSRTILDMGGAEKLLGKGDMLYYPQGESKPIRVQGSLITDKEVERIVNVVKANSSVEYDEDIMEHLENVPLNEIGGTPTKEDNAGECDEKLEEAIELVLETGQASTSLLQRRLSLGYARAARVMDQMEARGIIGPSNGAKPREILITREEFYEMKLNS
ncbi:MAG: DNA translocase FtsK 4TM domain-containing protein [Clostridia bacterium]|nr:DNA translocase FtsK 4TM domain-containing protein [Clostridia bacterium]